MGLLEPLEIDSLSPVEMQKTYCLPNAPKIKNTSFLEVGRTPQIEQQDQDDFIRKRQGVGDKGADQAQLDGEDHQRSRPARY